MAQLAQLEHNSKNQPRSEDDTMSIQDAAVILSVSRATVRNWMKSGLLTSEKNGRSTCLVRNDVLSLKQSIESGDNSRLKSRRNKKTKVGNCVPTNYVSDRYYENLAVEVLDMVEQMHSDKKTELILAEIAIKLVIDAKKITLCRPSSTTYLETLQKGDDVGQYGELVRTLLPTEFELSNEDVRILSKVSELSIPFCPGEDFLGLIYMSLNNLGARKASGSYYTPSFIVDQLVERCFGQVVTREQRAVDPCCGSGNFLIKLFYRLKRYFRTKGTSSVDSEKEAIRSLYGYDVDPIAIGLCRLNLALATECSLDQDSLLRQIVVRNSLCHTWDEDSFALVLGNPPWGFSFSDDELDSLRDNYCTALSGESFSLFIELGLSILAPNGKLAYVLPQSLLNVKLHEGVRLLLLAMTKLECINLLGHSFGNVYAPALTLEASKGTPAISHTVDVINDDSLHQIPQMRFSSNDLAIFNVNSTTKEQVILDKMKNVSGVMYLKGNATFALGIVTGDNNSIIHGTIPNGGELILKGSDIFKYNSIPSANYIAYAPESYQQVAPTKLYRAPEKLIYRFINERLIFAYDDKQTLTLNSANIVIPHFEGYSLKYILAVLNSRCAQFFFTLSFSSVKILRKHLESIPIPSCTPEQQEIIVNHVNEVLITSDANARDQIYDRIDDLISNLFNLNELDIRLIKESIPQKALLYR